MGRWGSAAMGQWLRRARELFSSSEFRVRHAILLTGSRNGESPQELAAAIAYCEGVFVCDCRGVGTDWEVSEVRKISTALLGTVDIVPDPAGLTSELVSTMQTAMSKRVAGVKLRLWTPQSATVRLVQQLAPELSNLTDRRRPAGQQMGDYPTGAWAAGERREYQLSIEAVPAAVGQEMLVARVSMVAVSGSGAQVLGRGLVRAVWTDDAELPARISPRLAVYTRQAELARLIKDGLEARRQEDLEAAAVKLGLAVTAALRLGRTDTFRLLADVVHVIDVDTGEVRLKREVTEASSMELDTRSAKTRQTRQGDVTGHVFISYVREDSGQVDQLQTMLNAEGIPVWRDTADLWPGEDWRAKIRHAITRNALVFIACFSQASLSRAKSYQNEELTLAIDQLRLRPSDDPWLIPVRLDECEIPDRDIGAGRTLSSIQRADLFGDRADEGGKRLTAAILRILKRRPDAA